MAVGQDGVAPSSVPVLGGVVERVSADPAGALLRRDSPGTAIAALFIMEWGESVMAALTFYFYGDQAAEVVAREKPLWQAWMQERFQS